MPENEPLKPDASPPMGAPLDYRPPGPEAKSQWWTDDQPGRGWVIGCLLVLSGGAAVIGAVFGVISLMAGC